MNVWNISSNIIGNSSRRFSSVLGYGTRLSRRYCTASQMLSTEARSWHSDLLQYHRENKIHVQQQHETKPQWAQKSCFMKLRHSCFPNKRTRNYGGENTQLPRPEQTVSGKGKRTAHSVVSFVLRISCTHVHAEYHDKGQIGSRLCTHVVPLCDP